MVKIEGTLAEIRDLFVDAAVAETKKIAKKAGQDVIVGAVKKTRKVAKSAWHKFMAKKSNQIKFKSGSRKGRLNLAAMSKVYKRSRK